MDEQRQHGGDNTRGRDGTTDPDPEAVSTFVERFAAHLVEGGMARMPARVFACLLSSDSGVLTSAELGERLRISPAAVSGAIRYLSQVDMVSREREPGSRRDRYRVHSDQWCEALTRREMVISRWESTLREGVESLGKDSPAGRRLNETVVFLEFLQEELPALLDRWRDHRDRLRAGYENADGPAAT
ncbi:hypothetical protein SSP35_03_00700 [Streptomyces sp. NBRC 110611]|uniref:GbsR/MarR family transcriptional regulator n=1 Tax=Streptomyces sp. NBRC 110611 TaxID=1621259 RepID=UPI0008310ED4|nr:MarR family transcriptional regulator [Streptomyces sp. NBRC 110611]GAU66422.1 hypothetical protein SSP35_03_00700 [Streptomyces sp. NBRC 110611]